MEEHKEHTGPHEHHTAHPVHHEHASSGKVRIKRTLVWQAISLVLLIALIASIYTGGFKNFGMTGSNATATASGETLSAVLLNDMRCKECDTNGLVAQLKGVFPGIEMKELDYSSEEGKEIYENAKLSNLPAVLFTESVKADASYSQVEKFLEPAGDYLSLRIGASFDPKSEICDNEEDDNGDGAVDCNDAACKGQWKCMEKKDKPVVEAFVMSHCPYGTQIEKGLIPVAELLKDKIDFKVKFCDYAMHGEKEVTEQVQQYCIQKEQTAKFLPYLKCFLKAGDSAACAKESGVDSAKLTACIDAANKQYDIKGIMADKAKWKGNFPTFPVFQADVNKYGIAGSPTLVINGATASTARDSASLLDAICTGFKTKPAECSSKISNAAPSPGFGFETTGAAGAATADAACGTS